MRALLLLLFAFYLLSCANVSSPTGGPKDTIPPSLIRIVPNQGQKNFHGSRIMLEFDEWLKLKNPKEEIIITPSVKDPKVTVKKNFVFIDLEEKLKDSTTYSIAFRESIQDLNEGNPAEDLHLAFSTGDEIDSLQIRGKVNQLLLGKPADKYTVAVYQSDTFNIFKHKPVYFTRTNKKGEFKILNLKAGDYSIYAFDDKNKNLLLESKSEKFGFINTKLSLNKNIDSLSLKAIALDSRPINITGIRALGHFTKVRYNKNLTGYKLTSLDAFDKSIRNCFSGSFSEIDIFPNKPAGDSTLIRLTVIDSLNQTRDSVFYIKQTTAKSLKEKIKISVSSTELIDDTQSFKAIISASEIPQKINYDSVFIKIDTIATYAFTPESFSYDSMFRKIRIQKTFQKKDSIKWKRAKLILGKGAIISIYGDSSKNSFSLITHITAEETATLIIESNAAKPNTLIELLDEQLKSIGIYPHSKSITIKNIKPGSVSLRAISDTNNNGKWDAGNPNKKELPEDIIFYVNPEGKQQTPLRANWEVDIKWNLK